MGDLQLVQGLFAFITQGPFSDDPFEPQREFLEAGRLFDEIFGSQVNQHVIGVVLGITGHGDSVTLVLGPDAADEFDHVHIGHPDIGDHDIHRILIQKIQGLLAAFSREAFISGLVQGELNYLTDLFFVVHHQDYRVGRVHIRYEIFLST